MESLPAESDFEFMLAFRETVEQYIHSVDEWEREFQKRYTMPRRSSEKLSPALEEANSAYLALRRKLEEGLPRARRIAFVHDIRAPYPALLRVPLGMGNSGISKGAAIGRNERLAIMTSLTQVIVACREQSHREKNPGYDHAIPTASWGEVFTHLSRVVRRNWQLGLRRVLGRG